MSERFPLGIVVEGPSDRLFFKSQRRWFEEQGFAFKIVQTRGRSIMIREAENLLESFRLKGCRKVFFFLDQHADVCPPFTAERLKRVAHEEDVVICVIARALEAWFVADEEAVARATGQSFKKQPTNALDKPKDILKELFKRGRHMSLTEIEMVRAICLYFSFERATEGNASLRRFINKLQG
ncbi:MAG: hypothetical protein ACETWB_01540 [Anaerolineae bacterium]